MSIMHCMSWKDDTTVGCVNQADTPIRLIWHYRVGPRGEDG